MENPSAITTYCPYATEIVHGGKTYTVSSATTLTITDCPCTLTYPIWTSTTTSCSLVVNLLRGKTISNIFRSRTSPAATWPAVVPTTSAAAVYSAATYAPTTSAVVGVFTGAASANMVGGALAGVVGVAAMLL
jgi:hypothetical protein